MKLATHDNTMETNAELVNQDFTIGDAAVIIEMLRKHAYQHRVRTLCQEYMSNARDASREVKSNKRIIVSVPNSLSPVFKVRDFGPGLTPHRLANVFIRYGMSTKRTTNGQTGGFGIGAKSAWCYTDSFTIVSITGGMKRTYVAHIGETNEGTLSLLSEVESTEETGTEIQVAVKPHDIDDFRNAIARACYFWSKEEYPEFKGLRSGEDGFQRHKTGFEVSKEFEINSESVPGFIGMGWHDKALLIIDGIPYAVNEVFVNKSKGLTDLIQRCVGKVFLRIGNGVLSVAMSRESVSDDAKKTIEPLNEICARAEKALKTLVTAKFKAAQTTTEWLKEYRSLSKVAHVNDYSKFEGYQINRGMIESAKFADIEVAHVTLARKRRAKTASLDREPGRFFGMDDVDHIYFNDCQDEPMVTQNKRLREYLERTNRTSMILLTAREVRITDPKWVRPPNLAGATPVAPPTIVKVSLADSKKALAKIKSDFVTHAMSTLSYTPTVRIPKAKRDRTKEMFTIHECTGHSKSPNTTTIAQTVGSPRKYLYVPFKDYDKYETEFNDLQEYMEGIGYTLCGMTQDSIEMVRGYSEFKSYVEWKTNFKPDAKTWNAILSTKAKNIKTMKLLARSNETIKHKHIALMMSEYKGLVDGVKVPKTLLDITKPLLIDFTVKDEKLTNIFKDEYNLLSLMEHVDWRIKTENVDELVYYINAKVRGK